MALWLPGAALTVLVSQKIKCVASSGVIAPARPPLEATDPTLMTPDRALWVEKGVKKT
jgi:hypothetical protein